MTLSKADFISAVKKLSVMELVEIVDEMKKEFNVSDAPIAMAAPMAGGGGAAAAEEKTEFSVILKAFGENKVNVIKEIRAITGLGLKEAKDLVEGAPAAVKEGIPKKDAEEIKKKLEEAGATVEIK